MLRRAAGQGVREMIEVARRWCVSCEKFHDTHREYLGRDQVCVWCIRRYGVDRRAVPLGWDVNTRGNHNK